MEPGRQLPKSLPVEEPSEASVRVYEQDAGLEHVHPSLVISRILYVRASRPEMV